MMSNPSNVLNDLRQQLALSTSTVGDTEKFALTAISKINTIFRPQHVDSCYADTIIVAQTTGSGCCYCYSDDPHIPESILGTDARNIDSGNRYIDVAVLDAAFSSLLPAPDLYCRLEGNSSQKAEARSTFILSEIQRMLLDIPDSHRSITMVGAVGNILSKLSKLDVQVFATDLDTSLIGVELGGVLVEDGADKTLQRIEDSNIALITGMTLATNTLDNILQVARQRQTKLIMFAQTGGNFAGAYMKMGIDCVITEEYPFYMFPGVTILRVFRRK